jgi:hypothetical protein
MQNVGSPPELYLHVRVLVSIILGLSVARLLNGVAGFVQHPARQRVSWVHLAWVAWLLVSVIAFWWWEFRLIQVRQWTFASYVFVFTYASLFFFLATLLFPDGMDEYSGFEDYFTSRRRWFFGLVASTFLLDVVDTYLKGAAHVQAMGPEYPIRTLVSVVLSISAMFVSRRWFHYALVIVALLYQVSWIVRTYEMIS